MRFLNLIIFLLVSESIMAQSVSIRGSITDSDSGQPIENTQISVNEIPSASALSDVNGNYSIDIREMRDKITIKFDAINHKIVEIEIKIDGKDIELNVKLDFKAVMLPDVNVQSGPETVYGNEFLNVADFVIQPKGILLLTYEKEERWKRQEDSKTTLYSGCRLILIDSTGKEITRKLITELCVEFYTNFFGDVFLRTHKNIHLINFSEDQIFLSQIENKIFEQQIEPIIDSIKHNIYLSNYSKDFPAFEYMIYNSVDSSQRTMRYIIDEDMMRMFRSEYKYLQPREKLEAFRFELETGVDREIIAAYMRGFQNTYYYEPLNAPLLVVNDTILLFDHHHDILIRFDKDGMPLDSSEIGYHKNNKLMRWSEKMVKDLAEEKVYTYFDRDGYHYVKNINALTGIPGKEMKLTHRYSDNIRIHNGYVYYVYRPYESSQNKFLYRERLQF